MIEIREIGVDKLNVLIEWREKVLREVFSVVASTDLHDLMEQKRRYYSGAIPNGEHIACFAYSDAEIVGSGGLCLYNEMPSPDNFNGKCGYLMNIFVSPSYRGQGIGKKIVRFLVEQAKSQSVGKIFLEAAEGSSAFYIENGFSPMQGYLKYDE